MSDRRADAVTEGVWEARRWLGEAGLAESRYRTTAARERDSELCPR